MSDQRFVVAPLRPGDRCLGTRCQQQRLQRIDVIGQGRDSVLDNAE